jgi:hypothetical protein
MKGFCTFTQLGRYGRFANQIFQIAGTIGIARKNALEPFFPIWRNYDHGERFGSKEDINVYSHMVNPLPLKLQTAPAQSLQVEWGYRDLVLPPGNWDITGHLQSPRYFEHCIDEVRHYMQMKKEPKETLDKVVIHARRGDYDNKYHPVVPVDWYVNAIKHFPSTSEYLVFSDDPCFISQLADQLVINGMITQANRLTPIFLNYLDSFAIMKKCQHYIIGNSSYSAAAAFLSDAPNKQVIAPRRWFGEAYAGITGDDIYGKDWIIL